MRNKVNREVFLLLKVLLITDNADAVGGAEKYFYALKHYLQTKDNLEVYSLTFGAHSEVSQRDYVIKAPESKAWKFFWQWLLHPLKFRRMRKIIKTINPDIVHLHNIKQYTVSLCKALKGYKLVQTIHDYGALCPTAWNVHKNWQPCTHGFKRSCFWQHQVKHSLGVYLAQVYQYHRLTTWQKKHVSCFLAPSPHLVGMLKQSAFKPAHYIQPFITTPVSRPSPVKPHEFLFAGNIGQHKGVLHLLQEFALAYQKNSQLRLTIAGHGDAVSDMHREINQLGLQSSVRWVGWQKDLSIFYDASVALIFPSLWLEAFGLVLIDAMSRGRAVIGSNRGSPTWLIEHGKNGFIFDPGCKGELASLLLKAAENPQLMQIMGENARMMVSKMKSNEACLNEVIEIYNQHVRFSQDASG